MRRGDAELERSKTGLHRARRAKSRESNCGTARPFIACLKCRSKPRESLESSEEAVAAGALYRGGAQTHRAAQT